ncbi:MAG TPA: ABC transporter substrate-binding protein [Candidatus Acetatifactor stercoripullorum]|uniref:ABC transporter substrate-binding protein n=1 Tax=Candidatus Acetatifactor stercoripullorum TaxID=2838414 RepID=A0A9D1UA33_9FIRM|nr:ABC transporter substrate-binding protein [uncultured Acetatifactor sp.]HIW80157.1 ABC transporter substrate-binding protein [Candidatus Acetatifactor stercoripullorum]
MKRKVLSVLLASAMVVSLAACGGEEASTSGESSSVSSAAGTEAAGTEAAGTEAAEEGSGYVLETLNMVVNGTLTATVDAGQAEFEAQWEEAVGEAIGHPIDLQIQQLDHSGYVDAVGRLFAGGDYPDVIIMSADMFKQYAPTGLLWDMAEAYENADFQSHLILPAINENLKDAEGHLYGFAPTYGNGCVTYVKKAWLDAVGIDASTIKTYDDYYNMLLAFHNGDPDGNGVTGDTYGVVAAGFMGNEAPWVNYLPEFWQDAYPALLQDESGVWYDGFQTEETKAALLRLRQAYVDGAIDPETLTASTKIAREKWFSNDQTGSSGVFTYWAGSWYQTLTDNLIKNEVDSELVQLAPIEEVGAYLNREAPVWCIIDDGDGDDSREQAIFDAFIETMMDGGTVQTLWTYGAEDVHWSTKAETFTTNPGTENEKVYEYADGEFHLKQSPNDPNSVWKKNHLDPALVVCSLDNGFADQSDLASEGNKFFTENCVDAPMSPASETYTNESGTIYDAKLAAITSVVVEGGDVEAAMQTYVDTVGSIIDQCLTELNTAE